MKTYRVTFTKDIYVKAEDQNTAYDKGLESFKKALKRQQEALAYVFSISVWKLDTAE